MHMKVFHSRFESMSQLYSNNANDIHVLLEALEVTQDPHWGGYSQFDFIDPEWLNFLADPEPIAIKNESENKDSLSGKQGNYLENSSVVAINQFDYEIDSNQMPLLDIDDVGNNVTLDFSGNAAQEPSKGSSHSEQEFNVSLGVDSVALVQQENSNDCNACVGISTLDLSHDEIRGPIKDSSQLEQEIKMSLGASNVTPVHQDNSSDAIDISESNGDVDVDRSIDSHIDQDNFQVVFKSLRSRSIFYYAIVGESKAQSSRVTRQCTKSKSVFPYRCSNCDHVFKFFRLFDEHIKTHQSKLFTFSCNICHFNSSSKWTLKRHVREKH